MENIEKIIFLLILLFSNVGITWANVDNLTPENVKETPTWFLVPPENEYVGVSLPLKDFDLAQRQATYAAFLSYIVQRDMEGSLAVLEESHKMYSTHLDTLDYNSTFQRASSLFFSYPALNYKIARIAKNQYGEAFVSIKVMSYNSDSQIRFKLEDSYYIEENVKQGENSYNSGNINDRTQMNFALQDSLIFEINGNIVITNDRNIESNETHREEKIGVRAFDLQQAKTETCLLDDHLNYQYTKTKMKNDWDPSYISKSHTLQQSLGAAYLTILLKLLSDKDFWMEEKQEPKKESLTADINIMTYEKRNKTQIVFLNITDNELFIISKE